jgi:hypothetical protein
VGKLGKKKPKAKPGPKPDVLKIEGNWKAAVTKSLKEKKPKGRLAEAAEGIGWRGI